MRNWKKVVLISSSSLEDAISTVDKAGLRIALVVDDCDKLVGTITDGDIRRALIKYMPMSTNVTEVMNKSPFTFKEGQPKAAMLAVMEKNDLLHLPIVTAEEKLAGLETLHGILSKRHFDNPVFLMAGGLGTRLKPLTDACPKPLLKIGQKPILEIILENFVNAGFHKFFISTHYLHHMVKEHFGNGSSWGVSIEYVHEMEPLGTAGALGLLPTRDMSLPLVMMNGDLLTNVNMDDLLTFHKQHKVEATVCVRKYDYTVPYGVVESDDDRVTNIMEKPTHSFFVNAGIYVLSPELVKSVQGTGYVDMPDLLTQKISAGNKVNMFPVHEYWLDIGQMDDFHKAQDEIGQI